MAGILILLMTPVGYNWGLRRMGSLAPAAKQRRRGIGGDGGSDPRTWGRGGDFVWMTIFVAIFWAGMRIWWR
jgi:hypothetical protein